MNISPNRNLSFGAFFTKEANEAIAKLTKSDNLSEISKEIEAINKFKEGSREEPSVNYDNFSNSFMLKHPYLVSQTIIFNSKGDAFNRNMPPTFDEVRIADKKMHEQSGAKEEIIKNMEIENKKLADEKAQNVISKFMKTEED